MISGFLILEFQEHYQGEVLGGRREQAAFSVDIFQENRGWFAYGVLARSDMAVEILADLKNLPLLVQEKQKTLISMVKKAAKGWIQ